MAGKYWWEEDEKQTTTQSSTQSSNKTEKKYWWQDDSKDSKNQGYWWDDGTLSKRAGQNIANRVNALLKNHSKYISDYKNRTFWRKYNLEDSYVSDSANRLSMANKQKSDFDAEVDSILTSIEQNKGFLNADWVKDVRATLERAKIGQSKILEFYTKDNEYWSRFGADEELVEKYGSAEDVYKYYQRSDGYNKKYGGMSSDDIKIALDNLEDGEEKDWLDTYQWSRLFSESDFDQYANAGAAIKNPTLSEAESDGRFLWWSWDGADVGNIVTYSRENADALAMAKANNENTQGNYVYRSMKDDEVKLYNYLLAKYGKEKGDEFLSYIMDDLHAREGGALAERLMGIDIPVVEELAIGSLGILAGVDQWASGARQNLTNDKQPTTPIQYANSALVNSMDGFGKYAYQATNVIGNMLPSIAMSKGLGALGAGVKAAKVAGAATMSIGAAGNAYADGLEYGMAPWQARIYGTLVGAAEGALEYAIGGIPALRGADDLVSAKIKMIDKSLLRFGAKTGWNIVQEITEEELQNYLEPAFRSIFTHEYDAPTVDELIETAIVTAISTPFMGSLDTYKEVRAENTLNNKAIKEYGDKTDVLIQEGLESNVNSESYKLATRYQQKTQGKDGKHGKALTGNQIRNLLAANQEQVTPKDMKKIQTAAEKRLIDLGQTEDVAKIAELATKRATGQELTRAEKRFLASSEYGSRVANELLPENIASGGYSTAWAEDIGTKEVNAGAYNAKAIREVLDAMANTEDPATYKSLEERVGTEEKFNVSESGQATIHKTDEAISLDKVEVTEFIKDKETGKVTDMVLNVDGKEVKASEIDYADDNQSHLFSAVSQIENITPADAQTIIRDYDPASGLSVGEYLNGIDEGFTYGYHGYSEADLKAGNFATKLSDVQANSAYVLGQNASKNRDTSKEEAIKRMRTAVEAEAEKAKAAGKEAPKAKKMTITYNAGSGNVVDFDKAGLKGLTTKQKAAPALAQVMHEMGLGTNFELYSSYLSKTMKDKKGNPLRVRLNENGVEEVAHSGIYRKSDGTVCIDLNAYNGKQLTLDAMSHELTHFIQQWSDEKYKALAEFLMKTYEKTDMSMHQRVLREQARLKGIRGKEVSYNEAFDEVVANAMSKMLADGKVMERLNELKAQDMDLAQKLWEGLKKLLKKFFRVYEKESALFHDAADLMELKAEFEQMQKMWAEALVEASDNFQAAQAIGFEMDVDTESVSPAVMHSEQTWSESEYVQQRDKAAQEIAKAIGVSEKKAKDYIDSVNSIAKMIAEDRSRLDYFSSPGRSSFVDNAEYGGSFDFSTLCKKRRLLTGTFTAIQKALPNTALTADEILDIRNRMKKANLEVSCGLCYVEGSRANMGQFAKEFLRLYKQYYPDAWQPNMADVNTPDGIEWVRINHPECYEQYEYFWNHYGTLKDGDKNLFASQQKPKLYQLHTEYKGEILDKFKNDDKVEDKNLNGGIRLQSFSDFEIVHLIDTMQIIMDMSRVGLAGQAYTKVPDFAWALGDTGLKINLSLIAKGVDENGNLIFDDVEGMPIAEAMKLRDRYSKNVGTILVAFNDAQLLAAMADDRVDFIIPFHRSQWKKSQYEAMGLPAKTKDYTFMQNEKLIKPTFHEYRGRMVKDKATNYMPNEYWDFSKSGKENAEAYLEMCARNNKRPKFYKLLTNNGDGSYSLKADGSTDGYWKLLIDFKMYDNDGIGSPQMAVKPEFNMEEATRMLNDYSGGHSNFPVAQGIVDEFVKDYKASHKGEMYSSQQTDRDYMDAVNRGDIDTAQKMVDEAAKRAGYTVVVYHGTPNTNTEVNPKWAEAVIGIHNILLPKSQPLVHGSKEFYAFDNLLRYRFGSLKPEIREKIPANMLRVLRQGPTRNFTSFSRERLGESTKTADSKDGFFVTEDELFAASFRKTYEHDVFLDETRATSVGDGTTYKLYLRPDETTEYRKTHRRDGKRTVEIVVKNANQLKSADPVTYDDNGNIIPISERFKTDNDDIRYSTQETDNISNRDLLANAFEGLSQNSEEYKLIQRYRGRIKILNELEEKLSKLNAEIRQIRFGKDGVKDTAKLRQLEAEAKNTAKLINSQDKKLLSLEASEPLRKVIEQERKKEAQKTRDHVKEIQQNRKVKAEQAEIRHKIRKAIRDLDKILNRGNKKQNVKEELQPVVTKALQAAEILFTDNYNTYDMLRNGLGVDLSDSEEALVKTCTQMLKDLDKMPTDGYENWQAYQEAESKLKTKMSKLSEVFARERKRLNNTTVSSILGELADAYASLENSEQSYVQGAYTEAVHNFLKNLQSEVGGTIVKDMTKDQLESVYAAYKMVLNTVRNANKMFNAELKQSREQLGNAVIEEVIKAGGVHLLGTKVGNTLSQASWNNMKPIWVGNRIGSDTFGKLMDGLFKGQYDFAVDIAEAKKFKLEMDEKYHPRNWDAKKSYEFESSTGKKFNLDLQQIMSLYAYTKRGEQAIDHLISGGFVFEKNSTVIVEKDGKKKTYIHKGAASYKLNEATLNEIINSLTAEQKAYVDEMQAYLSDVMGAKGNEVSMALYGIKMFNEQFYFPLRSSGAYMERAKEAEMKKQQGQINIVNSGFTHSVKPKAKNPIILSGFMDVWAEHCNEMSMYHSMVLPMEDFRKVYNYTTVHDENMESASVFQTIQDAYGEAATSYIDQLYKELNAGATIDPRETVFKHFISNFKKAAVMLSGSVVVQQFSSIGRAYAVIDPKYFVGSKVNSDTGLSAVEEMKKYAPVSIIKEMGGFDTGTKGNATSYIKAEEYHGAKDKAKGFFTDKQYRGDVMGFLPAWADEKTWCAIWEAAKRETKAKHPDMDVKSDAFLKLAGELFSEAIEKTQVYDSVLARSANMRSKGAFMNMATAFMAEPTTTVNLIESAIRTGKAKNIARAFGAVAVSIVLNNALASIVYAMRDDDEDETFIEKYFQSFTSGMIDDINPMTYYPFLKDVWSLFQGYDVERSDMSVIADVRDALKQAYTLLAKDTSNMTDDELAEHNKKLWGALGSVLDAGCSAFGVPIKNIRRDAMGIVNAWNTVSTDISGDRNNSWNSFWDKVGSAAKDAIPFLAWTKDKTKADKLYDAIMSGDKDYLARLKSGYKDDDAYTSAVRKALRENDSRIHDAAQARYDGNTAEYKRIFKEIQNEGKFSFDDIMEAVNSEESKIKGELEPEKESSEYSATDFVNAILVGDTSTARTMRESIISFKMSTGKSREEAEESFASSVSSSTRNAFDSGLLNEAGAKNMLMEYADMDEEDATSRADYWALAKANPKYRNDLNESNVKDYREFAEPANISLDIFVQYLKDTKGLATIYDEWGDVEVSKREQVLEVIDSLPLTWQQKDALYLAHGYSENTIWDVPW